jgi:hypothetical protein
LAALMVKIGCLFSGCAPRLRVGREHSLL